LPIVVSPLGLRVGFASLFAVQAAEAFAGHSRRGLGKGSDVRALLAAALIMGFAISREIGDADFEESRRRQLYDRLAAMLQACVSL
jgi:hypothetical protein